MKKRYTEFDEELIGFGRGLLAMGLVILITAIACIFLIEWP